MDRVKIKAKARELIKNNIWNLLLPFLITGLISGFASGILMVFAGDNETTTSLIETIVSLATIPLTFGCTYYVMCFTRKKPVELKMIFEAYNRMWPIIGLSVLMGIFITLWSLLLIIPGIIASLAYSQAQFLMLDGNDDPMSCIRTSKEMMDGYKSDYFAFLLSFIGWYLLIIVTFGLASIYVIPYVSVSEVLYFDELKKVKKLK